MAQKPKPKSGRPTKLDEKTVSLLETHLQFGHSVAESCYVAKISRETFYKWFRERADFSDRMRQARFQLIQLAKQTLYAAVANGDTKAAMWVIDKFAPDSFTAPLDAEIPAPEQDEAETQRQLEQWKRLLFYQWERAFMSIKYGRRPDEPPTEGAEFNVRQTPNPERTRDYEVLKKIGAIPSQQLKTDS